MLLLQVKILQSTLYKNSSTSTLCNIDSSRLLKEAGIVAESYLVTLFSLLMDLLNLEGHVCRHQDILFC